MEQMMNDLNAWCSVEFGRQRQLAKELGVSEQIVSHWIKGRRTPRLKHWLKLQEFLKAQRKARQKSKARGGKNL
jgi:predicted transcriptional regulator